MCCVGSSLIKKINQSMKVPRRPDIRYTITNNKESPVLFPVQPAVPPKHQEYRYNHSKQKTVKEKLHSEKSCNLIGQQLFDS